jgi:uncharacterized membrane protein YbhN (UPF0104 family)
MERKKSLKLLFSRGIKVTIVVVALLYIYRKLSDTVTAYFWLNDLSGFVASHIPELVLVVLLLPVNWLLEAYKWKILIQDLESITLHQAMRSVLAGVTFGTATPNRIGEFGGRVFFLKTADRIAATGRAFVGSLMQSLVTLVLGLFGFWFLQGKVTYSFLADEAVWTVFVAVAIFVCVCVVGIFLFSRISPVVYGKVLVENWKRTWDAIKSIGTKRQLVIFGLSFVRYLVYSVQFLLVLRVFCVSCALPDLFAAIAVTYFAITVIPTFALTEVVVRGSAAVYFIGALSCSANLVLVASLSIWAVNIAVPALIGIFFVFQLRFLNDKNNIGDDGRVA